MGYCLDHNRLYFAQFIFNTLSQQEVSRNETKIFFFFLANDGGDREFRAKDLMADLKAPIVRILVIDRVICNRLGRAMAFRGELRRFGQSPAAAPKDKDTHMATSPGTAF